MENRWNEAEARAAVDRYRAQGIPDDLALRVYSSRLMGSDSRLVLHGGGNTSVKGAARDITGNNVPVLYVKGSGWDLASIEPPGFPAVRLEPIRALRKVEQLSDEEMVNALRANLLDASAPNPSIEALLHAFLPHTFVDHSHADAILALVDQPDPEDRCAEVFEGRLAVLPFVFPGFSLAGIAMRAFEADPSVEGIVLIKHGLFTFGETARESYDRMIHYVSLAERALSRSKPKPFLPRPGLRDLDETEVAALVPAIRGALAETDPNAPGGWRRWIVHYRTSEPIRAYAGGRDAQDYARRGVVTPDHIIRTKNLPLLLEPPQPADGASFAEACRNAVASYRREYHRYFEACAAQSPSPKKELDPTPRLVLLPGAGVFAVGATEKDARIAADLFEHQVEIVARAESYGRYTPLGAAELFEMEYWSLEQAKLGKGQEKEFARQVVLITGAASGIGAATAKAFAQRGAHLVLLDRDAAKLETLAAALSKLTGVLALAADLTDSAAVASAYRLSALRFGGVDIVISNAGGVWQGPMAECPEAELRASFELNFFSHQSLAAEAVRLFRIQGTGGQLLFNASKSAFNPGPDLGPYTLPKAALVALAKQYALDYGALGIRSNAVNADRVNTALFGEGVLEARAQARGLSVSEYLSGNLLKQEVRADDVAKAFVALAGSERTTGAVLPVDGGNIAASPR